MANYYLRMFGVVALVALFGSATAFVLAENVKSFTMAGLNGIALPIDRGADVYIPPASVEIEVNQPPASPGTISIPVPQLKGGLNPLNKLLVAGECEDVERSVTVKLYDDDPFWWKVFWGADDLLDEQTVPCNDGLFRAEFTVFCHFDGALSGFSVTGPRGSSDESPADLYVEDGSQRIPSGSHWTTFCAGSKASVVSR